ncbi:uncharacterized protein LOC130409798 [Triplophysa dalaica]|uniref:uncharacterized protein LOC130409798 n=1 Tax=Triplophysa dalaica TaxID=1582913 RepID=UPI0024E00B91|nr:uncharacterized protein LOC130409798 [Triplophysa dalaica]
MTINNMKHIENGFKKILKKNGDLRQTSAENCQFILFFCYIASRAGTDIKAALDELDSFQVHKPVILVVFHHTFDHEKIILDSNAAINREQTRAVDCLFYETEILQCQRNYDAVDQIAKYLRSQKLSRYACLKEHDEHVSVENSPLICSQEPPTCCICSNRMCPKFCNWICRNLQNYCNCICWMCPNYCNWICWMCLNFCNWIHRILQNFCNCLYPMYLNFCNCMRQIF